MADLGKGFAALGTDVGSLQMMAPCMLQQVVGSGEIRFAYFTDVRAKQDMLTL